MEHILKLGVQEVLKPAMRRIGSLIAGGLLSLGAAQGLADQAEILFPALIAFLADLVLSHMGRK